MLCRRILERSPEVVFLTSRRSEKAARNQLATELRGLLAGPRAVTVLAGGHQSFWGREPEGSESERVNDLLIVDGPTQTELAVRSTRSLTLLLVRTGISQAALRYECDRYLDSSSSGLVMIRRAPGKSGGIGWHLPHVFGRTSKGAHSEEA
jgi:hypothetical protein